MSQKTVLVIDDDENLIQVVEFVLTQEGYNVHAAYNGQAGVRGLFEWRPDLVLLDISMPKMDGWETCRRIREVSDVPIIMLTARKQAQDVIRGLDLGADGYIFKPFQMEELKARVRATLRRAEQPVFDKQRASYRDDYLAVDLTNRRVLVNDQPINLTATEFKLLATLIRHVGQVLSPQQLLRQVWGWEHDEDVAYIRIYISHLRQKIEQDPKSPRYILTERGAGYRFEKTSSHT